MKKIQHFQQLFAETLVLILTSCSSTLVRLCRFSSKPWNLDDTSIFVVVDASVQRFKELLEVNLLMVLDYLTSSCEGSDILCLCVLLEQVCECQRQFARWEDGQQRDMPIFSGCRAPEFSGALLEIEGSFHHSLQRLRSCDKAILDILNITWCSEFNK